MRKFLTIVAMITAYPTSVQASTIFTGNNLLKLCDDEVLECIYYLRGLHAGSVIGAAMSGGEDIFCLPEQVTMGQMRDVVLASLRRFPNTRHHSGSVLAVAALRNAFPCK